ncbi:hypothetical protein Pdw03_5342 [Penicillium digitatum]|uniref:Rhodopsin domain-containing protein n=3 Tax=Penicillium digitatum TaxID=36651 RepID=K9G6B6_PEND2|nr:hypothetical protein PDIP_02260 [Penicillium digitatum Pd1]EKV17465.1 hypothetical protein PDIG_14800 [Penicillium digitatum PHI26]EKV21859.1 hypothetical protein PDIP_02260 [Penicillium digitatum Pd1]KAG0154710.1 hypothetical protein PDIDSM_278 [Penicillium digitatum]QQK47707.1 hypothetical protein Pdw03_5342 [Penicillium digitatum]
MEPSEYDQVLSDPHQVHERIIGSKLVIALEQCMLFVTWGVKVCLLILYWRITKNLPSNLYVKILAVYVALGFIVIMVTYYAVYCRPFSQYWALPVSNLQCATYQHYSITQAVFGISSDAFMFAIPIPLIIKARLPPRRKVLLLCVMSLGLFTIIAAILNKYFNFASPLTTVYQIWYIRESSTAIIVANMMCWWPLLRKVFGVRDLPYHSTPGWPSRGTNMEIKPYSKTVGSQSCPSFSSTRPFRLPRPGLRSSKQSATSTGNNKARNSSQEAINQSTSEMIEDLDHVDDVPLQVWGKGNERGTDIENIAIQESIAKFELPDHRAEVPFRDRIYCTREFDIRSDSRAGQLSL